MRVLAFILAFILAIHIPYALGNGSDAIIVSDDDAFYYLIASSFSFHIGKVPVILFHEDIKKPMDFIKEYGGDRVIFVGKGREIDMPHKTFSGDAVNVSFKIADEYGSADYAVVVPYNNYSRAMISTPIACYLNAPLLIYDNNSERIYKEIKKLGVKHLISTVPSINGEINLLNEESIYEYILAIKNISYIALTNPDDAIPSSISSINKMKFTGHVRNLKILMLSIPFNIFGKDECDFNLNVGNGIKRIVINVDVNCSNSMPCYLLASLYDEKGNLISYSPSPSYMEHKCFISALSVNDEGNYTLRIKVINGFIGGYFLQRGISIVNADVTARVRIENLTSPHNPLESISMLAPFLASSRNGMVISCKNEITGEDYISIANGTAGGAWNNVGLHEYVNEKVMKNVEKLERWVHASGAKYVAIVGDSNMIPMYYYNGSYGDVSVGYGIPSDNPYYLNFTIAAGRVLASSNEETSLLINREIFYSRIAHGEWMKNFTFISGEGYGEMAFIFHQLPYSFKVRKENFNARMFGDLRNSREMLEKFNAFDSNYVEYEGHGDWFWMFSNIYGFNYYGSEVDSAHVKNYKLPPNVIMTGACLMGRIDGIALNESIAMSFIDAGSNAFIGATRETGSEAKLEIIEDELLKNDSSIGKALMISKRSCKMPTLAARVLYGDPAFNPYP